MKIDTGMIQGYAEMSAEEKIAALEGFEIEDKKDGEDTTRLKAALSKANSEAADWKRQLREKQSEQERAEAERAEREAATEAELKSLRRDKAIGGYVAQCLSIGYSKDLALKAAEAMADGDTATVLNCQQEFIESKTKELEEAALKKQPTLTHGAPIVAQQAEKTALNQKRAYLGLPPIK